MALSITFASACTGFACPLKAASLAAAAFFIDSFFVSEEGEPCSCPGLRLLRAGLCITAMARSSAPAGSSCWAMASTLKRGLGVFQGLPQRKSGRALWKALPAGSSCAGAVKTCMHCWPTAHTKITVQVVLRRASLNIHITLRHNYFSPNQAEVNGSQK